MDLWIPENYDEMSYEEIRRWVKDQSRKPEVAGVEPQEGMVKLNLDLFENSKHVRNVCEDDAVCWIDSVAYSIMNKTDFTNNVYEKTNTVAELIGYSVIAEIKKIKFNPVKLKEFVKEHPLPFNFIDFLL